MLDIKFVRENPEVVKQNIRNKFQDSKLELVDKVLELDKENREIKQEVEALRAERNKISKQIGALMGQKKNDLQNNRIDFKKLANDFICNLTQLSFLRNVFQITLYKVLIFILGYQQTVPVSHFHLCPVISFHIFYVNQIPFVYTEKIRLKLAFQ